MIIVSLKFIFHTPEALFSEKIVSHFVRTTILGGKNNWSTKWAHHRHIRRLSQDSKICTYQN